jgi:hypothetical protein
MKYDDIQKLKSNEILRSEGINYARVMATRLYTDDWIYTLKIIFLAIFYEVALKYKNNNSSILLSHTHNPDIRKDYDFIVKKLKKIIDTFNELTLEKKINPLKVAGKMFDFFKLVFKNRKLNVGFSDLLRISALELYFKKIFNKLDALEFDEQLYISFSDSNQEENLFAQYFVNKKIKTATLQHGQYRYIKKGFEVADVEGYLNFVSDYFFAWGEKTRIEWSKAGIDSSRILKLGALKEFTKKNTGKKHIKSNESFVVILGGDVYSKSNIRMIKIANEISKQYKFKYYLRLHPMNKISLYLKHTNSNYRGVLANQGVDFSILHMTGVFVEMLSKSETFFVFEDDYTEEIFKLGLIKFNTLEDFSKKYNFLMNNKELFLNEMKNIYSEFNCASSDEDLTKNYQNAIKNILVI